MKLELLIEYTPLGVKKTLTDIRKIVGPGGVEFSTLEDSEWKKVVAKTKKSPVVSLNEYCDTLLSIGLARDAAYTGASRGYLRALGINTTARKAYQRALLAALNGVTQI